MSALTKTNDLRKKLDGDELDLSLMSLREIPVADIATLPKATKIDLANNELVFIPQNFATSLSHITKLELGSNKIKELPDNFGNLLQLKHLDLYNNQLTDLPLSMCNLKNLRYLDLKGNPLKPEISKIAGNCLNKKECQEAAKNVLNYLRKLNIEKEKQESIRLKQLEEKEMAKLKREEEEMARKKAEKKAAKEKKRQELQKAKEATNHNGNLAQINSKPQMKPNDVKKPKEIKGKKSNSWSLLGMLNVLVIIASLAVLGICILLYSEGDLSIGGMKAAWPRVKQNSFLLFNITKDALKKENIEATSMTIWKSLKPMMDQAWEMLTLGLTEFMNVSIIVVNSIRSGQFVNYLKELDWNSVIEVVRRSFGFMRNQFLVLKEEILKNDAITSIWTDLARWGSNFWKNTLPVLSEFLYKISTEIQLTYFPIVKEHTIYWFNYITNYVENLIN